MFIGKSIAQETAATLNGLVSDDKGNPIAGATITVLHEPTGAKAVSQTNKKGLFVLPNLKPGGPYTIKISFIGSLIFSCISYMFSPIQFLINILQVDSIIV